MRGRRRRAKETGEEGREDGMGRMSGMGGDENGGEGGEGGSPLVQFRLFPGRAVVQSPGMPFYEFYCPQSHRIYTFFARSISMADRIPRCPDNPEHTLEKRPSRFAVGTSREDDDGQDDFANDDPEMDRMMAGLERELETLDPDSPDPRQLGGLLRRMGQAVGMPGGAAMEEMIGRLEAGEDPERLEEEYGPMLDEADGPGNFPESDASGLARRLLRGVRRRPVRDPRVFEMADWL